MITTFDEYEAIVMSFATYPRHGNNIMYPALKLCGEAGEVAEKIGKLWRNFDKEFAGDYSEEERRALMKELGDVLWYVTACANELSVDLRQIANLNADKLSDRNVRGVIKSSGDDR